MIALIDRYQGSIIANDVLASEGTKKVHGGPEVIEIRDLFPPNHIRALFNFFQYSHTYVVGYRYRGLQRARKIRNSQQYEHPSIVTHEFILCIRVVESLSVECELKVCKTPFVVKGPQFTSHVQTSLGHIIGKERFGDLYIRLFS